MMQPDDLALLESARTTLRVPFRDPVRVGGQLMSRRLARQIERGFSRLKTFDGNDAPRQFTELNSPSSRHDGQTATRLLSDGAAVARGVGESLSHGLVTGFLFPTDGEEEVQRHRDALDFRATPKAAA